MGLKELREKHAVFIYRGFSYAQKQDSLEVAFDFHIAPHLDFRPRISLPAPKDAALSVSIDHYVFNLGLIELISYWKSCCCPLIRIEAGTLNSEQILWWKNLWINGLSEFFFRNGINPAREDLMQVETAGPCWGPAQAETLCGQLIPISGGKDSSLSLELLAREPAQRTLLFALNPTAATLRSSALFPALQCIIAKREIDPALLELNVQGYLNGHTPFSAYLAFLSALVAKLYGLEHIIVSNEQSANEENYTIDGLSINHQYSKTYAFEKSFRAYCNRYLCPDLNYFSFLRPLLDLQAAKLFARCTGHLSSFRSCNAGHKEDAWCGACAKCAFVYLTLFPHLPYKEITAIFGRDLFTQDNIIEELKGLLGLSGLKPFECVGTKAESELALDLALKHYAGQGLKAPPALSALAAHLKPRQALLNSWCSEHFLPLEYEGCLRRALRQSGTRLQAPPLRKGPILVLGYGREGKSTLSFLKKSGIADPIGVADKDCSLAAALEKEGLALHLGPSYLEAVNNYETVIKSPGIPYTARPGQYVTSATNIFFALTPGKTIGVTGTKGKSTTSALIAAMLKQQFKDVRLAGNIGSPMLDAMGDQLAAATDQTIFVVEVSSFQASNLVFSPDIAVILEIVAEHLDYHGSFEAYIEAKLNLARYQESPSTLIFNPAHADLRAKTAGSKAHKVYFDNEEGLVFIKEGAVWGRFECGPVAVIEKDKLPLLGPGNLQNVMAACAAAITCGLSASQIREAVLSFTPLPHRLEKVGTFKGITFINDSLATTPQAARNALLAFPGQVDTLIAGGFDRGLEFDLLGEAVTIAGVKNLILFPTTGEKIWAAVEKHCQGGLPAYFPVNSMEDAVRQAYACTTAGKFCLLSPAASSFNLFVDYKDRGDQFKRCVQAWA